jgi:hypothetical protein
MLFIFRVLVIAACAYAGSITADNQFPDLPETAQR